MSSASEPSTRRAVYHAWPLLLAMALIIAGNGLQGTLIGVRATLEGFPTVVVGFVMSGYFVGFLVGTFLVPRLTWRVGHIRTYAGLASLASTATLLHLLVVQPVAWGVFRVVTGFCLAGLYIVAESWLNGASTNATRGRLLAVYMVLYSLAMAASQGLFALGDPVGVGLFIVASVLVSLAVVPISLTPTRAPETERPSGIPVRELFVAAPLGMAAAAFAGLSNGAMLSAGPVYATDAGMSPSQVGVFMAAGLVGGLVFQWPIGALSDRFSRRRVILAATGVAGLVAILAASVDPLSPAMTAMAFAFGAVSYSMYSIAISHVNDVVPAGRLVAASAAMLLVNGVGAIAGPLLGTVAISVFGTGAFWWGLGGVHLLLVLFAGYRLATRRVVDVDHKRPYLPIPARSTLALHRLGRRQT